MQGRDGDTVFSMDLDFVPRKDIKTGYKTFELASTITQDSVTRGSSGTMYGLEPVKWITKAMEAAKEAMVFQPLVRQEVCGQGVAQLQIPVMTNQMAASGWETSAEEYATANTDILFTDITNRDAVLFEPLNANYAVAITNKALRRNALNLVEEFQRDLAYRMSYVVDTAISAAIRPLSGGPTEMADAARGIQTIFGGDATDATSSLASGDVLTPEMIKKAKACLSSSIGHYWSTNAWTKASLAKNAWKNEPASPLYMVITPEDEEALTGSSQFTNAAEFGDDSVIKNGYIGKYLGIKFVLSDLLTHYTSSSNIYVTAGNITETVDAHEAYLLKANYAAGLVWGQKPKFYAFDFPSQLQKRLVVEMAYAAKALYPDAVVRAIVSDQ